mmetsp:Transcript_35724/g.114875  ORF Transcript_35724/g.114875 Transcript_35724/m.114875 type:complete len:348 (+) Transcript_35724:103-1146(+)
MTSHTSIIGHGRRKRGGGRWEQHGAPLDAFSRLASELALAFANAERAIRWQVYDAPRGSAGGRRRVKERAAHRAQTVNGAQLRVEVRHLRDVHRAAGRQVVELGKALLLPVGEPRDVPVRHVGRDDPVDNAAPHRDPLPPQLEQQPLRLVEREGCRDGDDTEFGRLRVVQQRLQRLHLGLELPELRHRRRLVGRICGGASASASASEHLAQQLLRAAQHVGGAVEARAEDEEAGDEAVEEVGEGEQPQRVAGRRRVDDDAVKVDAVGVSLREGDDLRKGDQLVDPRRHRVEDVREVGEAEPLCRGSASLVRRDAAHQPLELGDGVVHLDLARVERCARHALHAHNLA